MKKIFTILFLLSFLVLTSRCSDDDSTEPKYYTIFSFLDSDDPTELNSLIDLSSYIDLEIDVADLSIATAGYDWDGNGFIVIPKKEGKTTLTVKEKNKIMYIVTVYVVYKGSGNWNFNNSKITVESDADVKGIIEEEMLERSLFYIKENEDIFNPSSFFFYYDRQIVDIHSAVFDEKKSYTYRYLSETKEYEFTAYKGTEKYLYKFELTFVSGLSGRTPHKKGIYYVDRTKEYQEKYPDKNVRKVIEEQFVEAY